MPAFLVLSSLSVAFYLVMLVALYRDGRRRSPKPKATHALRLGVVAQIGASPAVAQGMFASRQHSEWRVLFWAPGLKRRRQPEAQTKGRTSSELAFLRVSAHDEDDRLCS